MATAILGPELDIHCGGVDNIFPHHEAEIAQSECCTGRKFVRYWLHCAHLMVDGQKMSKSLGNFYTLRDLLEKGFTGREIRYVLLTVNYRLPLNFTFTGLESARVALSRIDEWAERLAEFAGPQASEPTELSNYEEKFFADLDDDLNISGAMGHLFDLIRESNKAMDLSTITQAQAAQLIAGWQRINSVLGIERDASAIPAEVLALVEQRRTARAEKNWAASDQLRDQIATLGWIVKDTKEGPKLTSR
jgi:cysteinyl-tRNA synthetase